MTRLRFTAALHTNDHGEFWVAAYSGDKCCMETDIIGTGYFRTEKEARERFALLTKNYNIEVEWKGEKK
jgi:hypothetical protein